MKRHTQKIYPYGLDKEVLIIIAKSNRVDPHAISIAKKIFLKEFEYKLQLLKLNVNGKFLGQLINLKLAVFYAQN